MKHAITKNNKCFKILNKLILNGFYEGSISPNKFELSQKRFNNNFRLIGTLNNDDKFELSFDYKHPTNIAVKVAIALGLLTSIVLIINGNWIIPIAFIILGITMWLGFKLKEKKEIDQFINKYLEYSKENY